MKPLLCSLALVLSCGRPVSPAHHAARTTPTTATTATSIVVECTDRPARTPTDLIAAPAASSRPSCQMPVAGGRYLRDLTRQRGPIADPDIRATAEYRSLMAAHNRWQWRDRVTDTEALAVCRAMLTDLRAGRRVSWARSARTYLNAVRAAATPPATAAPVAAPAARPHRPAQIAEPEPAPASPSARLGPDAHRAPSSPQTRQRPPRLRRVTRRPDMPTPIPDVLDHAWQIARDRQTDELSDQLQDAQRLLQVVGVFLAGVHLTVTYGGQTLTMLLEGETASDLQRARRLAEPALRQLARTLEDLPQLTDGAPLPPLTLEERAYLQLARRPADAATRLELETLHALRQRVAPNAPLIPGETIHKAQRWHDYLADTKRPDKWPFRSWSRAYEVAVRQPARASAVVDRYHRQLGWGKREVAIKLGKQWRVLDIADFDGPRAVEVKLGYVSLRRAVARQIAFDKLLVDRGWRITWYIDGHGSDPLKETLFDAGIHLIETKPRTPPVTQSTAT